MASNKPDPVRVKSVNLDNRFKRPRSSAKKRIPKDKRIKEEISRTLMDQIYLEKEVEALKLELASAQDFTCKKAFALFDQRNLESLT